MSLGPGQAEFNGNAVIRGAMVGATGTFSGKFATDNLAAVDSINIKDGAVSGFYSFSSAGATDVTFTVPAQSQNFTTIIHIPLTLLSRRFANSSDVIVIRDPTTQHDANVSPPVVQILFYVNGAAVVNLAPMNIGTVWQRLNLCFAAPAARTFTYFDPDLDSTVANTFRIRLLQKVNDKRQFDSSGYGYYAFGNGTPFWSVDLSGGGNYTGNFQTHGQLSGPIITEFRKR